jgi:hypothetical protein
MRRSTRLKSALRMFLMNTISFVLYYCVNTLLIAADVTLFALWKYHIISAATAWQYAKYTIPIILFHNLVLWFFASLSKRS